jgi:hypothetical protein
MKEYTLIPIKEEENQDLEQIEDALSEVMETIDDRVVEESSITEEEAAVYMQEPKMNEYQPEYNAVSRPIFSLFEETSFKEEVQDDKPEEIITYNVMDEIISISRMNTLTGTNNRYINNAVQERHDFLKHLSFYAALTIMNYELHT